MVLLFSNITAGEFLTPVLLSLRIAFIAIIIVFISATMIAKVMVNTNFKGKIIIETILMMPLVLPPTVVGFLLIILFGNNGLAGDLIQLVFNETVMFTWYGAVIASTVVAFPLMYQSAKAGFLGVDKDVENAAKVDGASNFQVFIKITMPMAATSLITGVLLSFARAIGEFGATLMIAGNIPGSTQTMPTAIYVAMQGNNMTLAWAWVITIIVISFAMLLFVQTKANG